MLLPVLSIALVALASATDLSALFAQDQGFSLLKNVKALGSTPVVGDACPDLPLDVVCEVESDGSYHCAGECCYDSNNKYQGGCKVTEKCDFGGGILGCCPIGETCSDDVNSCVNYGESAGSGSSECPATVPICTSKNGGPLCSNSGTPQSATDCGDAITTTSYDYSYTYDYYTDYLDYTDYYTDYLDYTDYYTYSYYIYSYYKKAACGTASGSPSWTVTRATTLPTAAGGAFPSDSFTVSSAPLTTRTRSFSGIETSAIESAITSSTSTETATATATETASPAEATASAFSASGATGLNPAVDVLLLKCFASLAVLVGACALML